MEHGLELISPILEILEIEVFISPITLEILEISVFQFLLSWKYWKSAFFIFLISWKYADGRAGGRADAHKATRCRTHAKLLDNDRYFEVVHYETTTVLLLES